MFRRLFRKSETKKNPSSISFTSTPAVGPMFLPPFRPFNDFFCNDKRRWNKPDFSDRLRLKHRVTNNLIYYQRNYFALAFGIIALCESKPLLPTSNIVFRFFYTLFISGSISVLCILIHAMYRKRSLSNKVANSIEKTNLVRTPMGLILDIFGLI